MINKLFKNDLYKDVATLVGGTGIAQTLPILISPILTRIYTPDQFGILAFYMAVIAVVGVASTGRYELAILLPKKDSAAYNLAGFSTLLALGVSIVSFILFMLFGDEILGLFGFEPMPVLYYAIPAGIFALGLFQISTFLLNRIKKYNELATAKIARSGGVSVGQLIFGFAGFPTFGLVYGKLIGELFSALYARWLANKDATFNNSKLSWIVMKAEAITYREMPKVNTPHAVSNTLSNQLPNILLAGFFSPAIAGFYNLSYRICYAPVMLISSSVYQVYSRSVSENQMSGKDIHYFTTSILKKLTLTAILPFTILLIFAPSLFELIFGSDWRVAGFYSQLLAPLLFLVFVVSPVTYIPILLGHQRKAFILDVIYLILRTLALFIGYYIGNATVAIAVFCGIGIMFQVYLLIWLLSLTRTHNLQAKIPYE